MGKKNIELFNETAEKIAKGDIKLDKNISHNAELTEAFLKKIYDKDDKKKKEYLRIKEKTIGVEFELEPDKKNAIDSFLSELSLQEKEFFSAKAFEI